MKHAGPASLAQLAPLLERIRALGHLTERKPGTFYRRSSAFLHFHEDPTGLFADLKTDGKAFTRFAVNGPAEQEALVALVAGAMPGPPVPQDVAPPARPKQNAR
jgi:hypothetical protein